MIDHPSAELVEASKWILSAFIAIIIWLLLEVRIKRNSKNSPNVSCEKLSNTVYKQALDAFEDLLDGRFLISELKQIEIDAIRTALKDKS